MADVSFVAESHTANTTDNATSTVVNKPAGVVDGDLMIALLNIGTNSSTTPTPPAGWTAIDNDTHGASPPNTYLYYKVASSEGASYSWAHGSIGTGGSQGAVGAIAAFRNAYTSAAPAYSKNYDSTSDTTANGATVSVPAAPGGYLLAFVAAAASVTTSGYAVANNNPTWTEDSDEAAGTKSLAVAHAPYDLAQATGAFTATLSGSSVSAVYLIAVVPSAISVAAPEIALTSAMGAPTTGIGIAAPEITITAAVPSPSEATTAPSVSNVSKNSGSWTNQTKHDA